MPSPKFLVFKLKDLRIPILIILIVAALFVFFIVKNKTEPTYAPFTGYSDGRYIAGIHLSDAELDVVVDVSHNNITSIALSGLDETSSTLYKDLVSGIDYINTYVTATQSLNLPTNDHTDAATLLLMDAIKIALSDNPNASVTNTYEKVNLDTDNLSNDDIFTDEFQDEDFLDSPTTSTVLDSSVS